MTKEELLQALITINKVEGYMLGKIPEQLSYNLHAVSGLLINAILNGTTEQSGSSCKTCGKVGTCVTMPSTATKKCIACHAENPWKLSEGQKPVGYGVCPEQIHKITE